ncbi:type IV secretion system protein VirB8 [Dyella jiangningensis]|uniref:virB8 family protein n=1 Tax=Dyella sp. AtDHG13 TaxID=1938897 RepID=UPI0008877D0B|nr:type IV secretion system protein [Dyella sp. AtDHG13]PXV59818.1 type IV secretion system protein VirB8 [Dyella sp. AtDHG13]SDJ21387.1 type IV secretion system protein VirB8 [Dyella jiangningensis]
MLKKKTSSKIDEAVAKSVNYELTVADIARRSERRAWWVAFSAIGMSLILAGGYFYMLPLKEKIPYVVMADAYTGTSTVARLNEDFLNQRISTSEAINRSNVAHFVLARESYDVAMINLRDWATVLTMSAPSVAAGYTSLHASTNPNSPYKLYGRDKAIRVKILSIVLINGANGAPKGATVRFQRSLFDKQTGASRPLDSKIATLEFTYKPNLKMDEQYRIENPLGFQVTNYRVDSDYATAPPEEVQSPQTDTADSAAPASSTSSGEVLQSTLSPQPPMSETGVMQAPPAAAPAAAANNSQGARH